MDKEIHMQPHSSMEVVFQVLNKLLCDNTLECALHVKDVENTRLSFFVKEMLLSWSKLMPKSELPEEIGKQVLWFSKYIIRPDGKN